MLAVEEALGTPRDLAAWLVRDEYDELGDDHPAIELLKRPNPWTSGVNFWANIIMHLDLAGNAYVWKGRVGGRGAPVILQNLRPDRVRCVPDADGRVRAYRYTVSGAATEIGAEDVIHFKTRHPFDDHYGMPPLMPISSRVDIDNYMRDFVGAFFRNGGQPGAILSTKTRLAKDAKEELIAEFQRQFGGPGGWFDVMVIDGADASYTPMTMQLGQRGLVVPELNAISETRIAMIFGVPVSILGALVGQESSSYANKRQDWQVFWDITLAPLYSWLDDQLNLGLLPDFPDVDEFKFDLSNVRALQEDTDATQERHRKNLLAGAETLEEARPALGLAPQAAAGGTYYVPTSVVVTKKGQPTPLPAPDENSARLGRPRLEDDPIARDLYERGEAIRRDHPGLTLDIVASRLGVASATYRRYRAAFRDRESDTF